MKLLQKNKGSKSLSRRRIANPELSPIPCSAADLLCNLQQTHVMSFRKLLITNENVIYYLAIRPLITALENLINLFLFASPLTIGSKQKQCFDFYIMLTMQ